MLTVFVATGLDMYQGYRPTIGAVAMEEYQAQWLAEQRGGLVDVKAAPVVIDESVVRQVLELIRKEGLQ